MVEDRMATLRDSLRAMGSPLVEISAPGEAYLVECRYCKEVCDTTFGFQHAADCPYEIADLELERLIFEREYGGQG